MAILFLLNALVAIGLIILILLQRTDSGAGGAFGGGASGGQVNIRNPLAKPTAILAAIFLVSSLVIAMLQHGAAGHGTSVIEDAPAAAPAEPVTPALPEASLPGAAPEVATPTEAPVPAATAVTATEVSTTQ
jgi:preprotein translocase subunit SecG